MIRSSLVLVDDHRLVAAGLAAVLSQHFEIRAILHSALGLVSELARLRPDGLLLDISMPGLSGLDAARQIRQRELPIRVLMVTMHAEPAYAVEALAAGASGFVLKTASADELIAAIKKVLAGGTYVAPSLAPALLEGVELGTKSDPLDQLTRRQREVLQLVADGRTAREVGSLLGISARTAEFHKYRAMDALNLRSKRDLIKFALQHRLLGI